MTLFRKAFQSYIKLLGKALQFLRTFCCSYFKTFLFINILHGIVCLWLWVMVGSEIYLLLASWDLCSRGPFDCGLIENQSRHHLVFQHGFARAGLHQQECECLPRGTKKYWQSANRLKIVLNARLSFQLKVNCKWFWEISCEVVCISMAIWAQPFSNLG